MGKFDENTFVASPEKKNDAVKLSLTSLVLATDSKEEQAPALKRRVETLLKDNLRLSEELKGLFPFLDVFFGMLTAVVRKQKQRSQSRPRRHRHRTQPKDFLNFQWHFEHILESGPKNTKKHHHETTQKNTIQGIVKPPTPKYSRLGDTIQSPPKKND